VAALANWPVYGVPPNPGGWLMIAAKRRAIDLWRRRRMMGREEAALVHGIESQQPDPVAAIEAKLEDDIGDERLSLMFAACHPLLSRDQRTALTLKVIAGLGVSEIARAFLTQETTIAQRIVRAKKILRDAGISFEVPRGEDRHERLASVLEAIYLIFNEGYAASNGNDLTRPQLCQEAMRLGRSLTGLAPKEPEARALLALMELHASRLKARISATGEAVTLEHQNRAQWDRLLIQRGLEGLDLVQRQGGANGVYALQAALAAEHAKAPRFADTRWETIASLYDRLLLRLPTAVVALNRAVAHAMAHGPAIGLELLGDIENAPALARYAPLYAAKADFLMRLNRSREAAALFHKAAHLSNNATERRFLQQRASACEIASN
jgi:predicted RNA polymerase sigma factor